MSDLLKYKQVNWIDGMKINKDHFISMENHFTARFNDINSYNLNYNSFGLLPHKDDKSKVLNIRAIIDNQNFLKVNVTNCSAITPGGFRIEIGDESEDHSDFVIQQVENIFEMVAGKDDDLFVIISVNPFSRFPEGKANAEELPLRLPYVRPRYELHLLPAEQVIGYELGPDLLIVGRIKVKNNIPEIDQEYIPPCFSIEAHPKLVEFYNYIDQQISSLEKSVAKIIYDINEKHASNILTEIVTFISENLLYYIGSNITRLRWMYKLQPPINLFEFIVTLSRVLKNAFDIRTAEEKETLLNYFSEHFDIVQSQFKKLLDNTIGLNYEHTDISYMIVKSKDFLNVISPLFNELSKMELIAGGKKKAEPRKIDIILR